MIDQKRENLLNLALAATEVERRRVPELSAGYNSYSKTWEVIVQYQGDLAFLEEQGVRVTLLLFSYAILLVPESLMDYVTGLPQITYLEKPKLLCFSRMRLCGAYPVLHLCRRGLSGLYGNGVLLACIDSGVDYAHPDFCAPDGTSRIALLWDQTIPGNPPTGYALGSVYTRRQINEALAASSPDGAVCPRAVPRCDGAWDSGSRNCRRKRAILCGWSHAGRGTGSNARCRKAWKS